MSNKPLIAKLRTEWPVGPGNRIAVQIMNEAAAALEAMEWNPDMDEAPRNGTRIDLIARGVRYTDMRWGLMCFLNEGGAIGLRPSACTHWKYIILPETDNEN